MKQPTSTLVLWTLTIWIVASLPILRTDDTAAQPADPPRTCTGNNGDYCISVWTGPTHCDGRVRHRVMARIDPGPNGETRTGDVYYPGLHIRYYTVVTGGVKDAAKFKVREESITISSDDGWVKVAQAFTPVDSRLTQTEGWFTADGMALKAGRNCA